MYKKKKLFENHRTVDLVLSGLSWFKSGLSKAYVWFKSLFVFFSLFNPNKLTK